MAQPSTSGYTADLPARFALIKILCAVNVVLGVGLFAYGYFSKTPVFAVIAAVYIGFMFVFFALGMLQQRAYRQPAVRVLPEGLVYYGAVIPWTAIRQAGVLRLRNGPEQVFVRILRNVRFGSIPGERPNSVMFVLLAIALRLSNNLIRIPIVKERDARSLAREIAATAGENNPDAVVRWRDLANA